MAKPYKGKLRKCPHCNEQISYMFDDGKKIAIIGHTNKNFYWKLHTCYIELPNK